jgi:membrane-bound lytic murein transglycosylase A
MREMQHFSERLSNFQPLLARCGFAVVLLVLVACESTAPKPPITAPAMPPAAASASPTAPSATPAPVPAPVKASPPANDATLQRTTWDELPEWRTHDMGSAWETFLTSCSVLAQRDAWRNVCTLAQRMNKPDRETVRRFFESHFSPHRVVAPDGARDGLITGYYEPLVRGSRSSSERYRHPIYGVPDDLLTIDLGDAHPELKGKQLRGRLEGRRVVSYYDRAGIESGRAAVRGREIAWLEDPIELFFLQIQGSGRIELDDGRTLRVGYADQNGHPYRSIGRWLVERGELTLDKASMQGIKGWAQQNPERLKELLHHNARYIFFRELPPDLPGPLGALGVPLTARRSMAVDPQYLPLGSPVYIATTWPNSATPLNRLMLAQDTGGAIRGAVRADFFWGFGPEAAREAGRMKQALRMWVMLPHGYPVSRD